jgi:hypothetical protein
MSAMRLFLLLLLTAPGVAFADAIVLKNGDRIVGRVITETPSEVSVSSGGVTWTFKRDKIDSVSHDEAEAKREKKESAQNLRKLNRTAQTAKARRSSEMSHEERKRREFRWKNEQPPPQEPVSVPDQTEPERPAPEPFILR